LPVLRIGWLSAACWPVTYPATLYLFPAPPVIVIGIATAAALAVGALVHRSWPEVYVELRLTDDGFIAGGPGVGPEREAGWPAVTRTSVTARQVGSRRRGGVTYFGFAIEVDDQWAVRIGRTRRFARLLELVNARTPHLPYEWALARRGEGREVLERVVGYVRVPRAGVTAAEVRAATSRKSRRAGDVTISTAPPNRGVRVRNRLMLLLVATGAMALVAPDDPVARGFIIALPAMFLVPLLLLALCEEFLVADYVLASQGATFTVTKRRLNREELGEYAWDYVVSTNVSADRLVVQLHDGTTLRLPALGPVVAFFNDRAPLDYEWVSQVKDREVIESGLENFAKVRRG
jgi:hypothetical protein